MKRLIFLVFFTITFIFSINVIAQELVLYYPFDGGGDKVTDKSGNGNDGAFDQGKGKLVASKEPNFGQAMQFDGQSRIAINDSKSLAIGGEISFVMWVKKGDEVGGTGTLPRIISRTADKHELAMDSGNLKRGTFAIYFGGNPGWTTCMPVDMEWHHIAVVFDGSKFNVYLDGEPSFELKSAGPGAFSGVFYIGSRCDLSSKEFFNGLLDELGVFSGVLKQDKIKEIMKGGVTGQLLAVSPQEKLGSA